MFGLRPEHDRKARSILVSNSLISLREFVSNEDGWLAAIGGALAKAAGLGSIGQAVAGAAGSVLGGRLSAREDRRNATADYERMRALGFTHSEIVGSGAAGSGTTQQAVMGNQATQFAYQRAQQEFENLQRDKDRAVALSGQATQLQAARTSAAASIESARTSAGASMYSTDANERINQMRVDLEREKFKNIELPQALNRLVTESPNWKRQELLARMGVDNVIATAIAGARGIDIMDPDTLKDMTEAEFREMVIDIYGLQSTTFKETAGATGIIESGIQGAYQGVRDLFSSEPTLGR